MLWLVSYCFLLRLPSEVRLGWCCLLGTLVCVQLLRQALPMRKCEPDSEIAKTSQSIIWREGDEICLRLLRRKNRQSGSRDIFCIGCDALGLCLSWLRQRRHEAQVLMLWGCAQRHVCGAHAVGSLHSSPGRWRGAMGKRVPHLREVQAQVSHLLRRTWLALACSLLALPGDSWMRSALQTPASTPRMTFAEGMRRICWRAEPHWQRSCWPANGGARPL